MKTILIGGRKGMNTTLMLVLLLFIPFLVLTTVVNGKFNSYYENQPYNNFVCKQMAERQGEFSINEGIVGGLLGSITNNPLETGLGAAECGLVLPQVTGTKENIIKLITDYGKQACEYGNNVSRDIAWVKSLPVKVTDEDINYADIAPSTPGMAPCYLIWRIDNTYIKHNELAGIGSELETDFKSGKISKNMVTTLSIDFFHHCSMCPNFDYVEIWGVPSGE